MFDNDLYFHGVLFKYKKKKKIIDLIIIIAHVFKCMTDAFTTRQRWISEFIKVTTRKKGLKTVVLYETM